MVALGCTTSKRLCAPSVACDMDLRGSYAANGLIGGEFVVGRVICDLTLANIGLARSGLIYRPELSALLVDFFADTDVYGKYEQHDEPYRAVICGNSERCPVIGNPAPELSILVSESWI